MGLMDRFLGAGATVTSVANAATGITEVFRENSTRRMELDERELDIRHQAEALKVAAELDRLAGGAWILDGEE